MVATRPASTVPRRTAIADAVIALLAAEGSRRVTHRAVDRYLNMPEGSTSAYFRTRASLFIAATNRLAELDRASMKHFAGLLDDPVRQPNSAQLIAAVVDDWTAPQAAPRQLARLELQLEARRSPELADVFAEQRTAFLNLAQTLAKAPDLPRGEPADSELLASTLTALVDGLIYDRLLHPRTALAPAKLPEALTHLLAGARRHH